MTYVFDTDTLSALMRARPLPHLVERVRAVAVDEQATTAVNLGELWFGVIRLGDRGLRLRESLSELITANLQVLPFDAESARVYGEIRANLEAEGRPIGDADLRIASIALSRSATVVTGNMRHFERVPGLRVENWFEPPT